MNGEKHIYIVNNKIVETSEVLSKVEFSINGRLEESGLGGKYLADVEIKDPTSGKKMNKNYFCSITKKDEQLKKYFIFLNHLEEAEIVLGLDLNCEE